MRKRRIIGISTAALALSGALAWAGPPEGAQEGPQDGAREKCFGVAAAGQNDGLGLGEDAGKSRVDFQGDAWSWVARGTCLTMTLPAQADGTPRRGAIRPLDRDRG